MYDFGSSPRRDFFDSFREYDPEEEERILRLKGCYYDEENEFDRDDSCFGIQIWDDDDLENWEEIVESLDLLFKEE